MARKVRRIWEWLWTQGGLPVRFTLVVGLIFGLAFLVLIPPMQGPDEPNHFLRVYQLSEGTALSPYIGQSLGGMFPWLVQQNKAVGGNLPDGVVSYAYYKFDDYHEPTPHKYTLSDFRAMDSIKSTGHVMGASFPNTAVYSPVAYLPDIIGMWVGRAVSNSPAVFFYTTRLAALLFGVSLIALSVRLIPFGKLPLAVIALLPMTIAQESVITADTTAIAFSFLAVSLVLRTAFLPRKPFRIDYALLVLVFLLVGLSKPSLLPLLLITPALLINKHIRRRDGYVLVAASILATVVPAALWDMLVKKRAVFGYGQSYTGVNYHYNLVHLLEHPHSTFLILGHALFTADFNYPASEFIGNIGWQNTPLPVLFVGLGYGLLCVSLLIAALRQEFEIPGWVKWLAAAAGFGIIVTTALYLYLLIEPEHAITVTGIQGRYLLPAAALLPVIFSGSGLALSKRTEAMLTKRCLVASAGLLLVMSIVIGARYYNLTA